MPTLTPSRRNPDPPPSDQLRDLAGRVRRLAVTGRLDPEQIYTEKSTIAAELARLAHELDRRAMA